MDREARRLGPGDALHVVDVEQRRPIGRPQHAGVRDLATALRVERRPVQHDLRAGGGSRSQLDLGHRLERLVLDAVAQDGHDAAVGGGRLVAQELRGRGARQDLAVARRGEVRLGESGLRMRAAALPLLGEGVLEAGQVRPDAVLRRELDGQVDREAVRVVEPERHLAREDGRVGRKGLRLAADDARLRRQRDERLLEQADPGLEGAVELALLALDDAQDLGATLREVRVGDGHRVDDDLRGLAEERLVAAEEPAVADRAAHDPAQDIAAALVRREHAVGDEERDGAAVVRDDLVAEPLRLEGVRVRAQEVPHAREDRREQVRVVVVGHALDDAGDALQAHARVHAGCRQRGQAAVRVELELHEHEVPDLEPARAVLAVVGDALRALGEVGAAVVVELAARAARTHVPHPPPVRLVAGREVAPADQTLRRQPDLVLPDRVRRGRPSCRRSRRGARRGSAGHA